MAIYTQTMSALGFVAILGACTQAEPAYITPEPIFNKLGEAIGCRSGDGTITDLQGEYGGPEQGQRNPCEPRECIDGYNTSTQVPCSPPYREPDDPQTTTGNNNPQYGGVLG